MENLESKDSFEQEDPKNEEKTINELSQELEDRKKIIKKNIFEWKEKDDSFGNEIVSETISDKSALWSGLDIGGEMVISSKMYIENEGEFFINDKYPIIWKPSLKTKLTSITTGDVFLGKDYSTEKEYMICKGKIKEHIRW